MNKTLKPLTSMRNIGCVCAGYLYEAGIQTPEELRKVGAKEALLMMFEKGVMNALQIHPCYLYALQGAIDDVGFNEIPEDQKEDFKKFSRELRASIGIGRS